MKKLAAILITGILMTGLVAGCGSTKESNQPKETKEDTISTQEAQDNQQEKDAAQESASENTNQKVLVVYFSGTGNTEAVAETIADITGGELFQLEPEEAYTSDDMDYNNKDSRVCKEHEDESLQDVKLVKDTPDDWSEIQKVFVGYPIWWGNAAWPVNEFIKTNDFTGKTVIPFCTSASSSLGNSAENLKEMAGTGDWQEGTRFPSGVSKDEVQDWVNGLGL